VSPAARRAIFALATSACAVGLALTILVERPFLSNDGPAHAAGRFIHDHIDDPALGYAKFHVATSPWSSRGFDEIFSFANRITNAIDALDITVVVVAEAWAFAFLAFVAALDRRRAIVGLLGFGFALQASLYLGFYPFMLGTAFSLLAFAVSLYWCVPRVGDGPAVDVVAARPRVLPHLAIAALLALSAHCHVVATAITGLVLGSFVLARTPPRAWPAHLGALFFASLPALAIAYLARGAAGDVAGQQLLDWRDVLERTAFIERGFQPAGVIRPLAALALALAGVLSCAHSLRATGARTASPAPATSPQPASDDHAPEKSVSSPRAEERALLVVGVAFLILSMALPRDLVSWQLANVRLLPIATAALVSLLAIERFTARNQIVVVTVVVAYVAGSFAWAASFERALADATKNALAGLEKLPPEPRDWLPVIVKPFGDHDDDWGIDGFAPLIHLGNLYVMELGGATEYGHTSMPSMHLAFRNAPHPGETPPPDLWLAVLHAPPVERASRLRTLLASAATREGLIYYGEPGDRAILDDMGFVSSFADPGGLYVGHFEGCDAHFAIDGPPGAKLSVEAGFWPRRTPAQTFLAGLDASGHASVDVPRFACGEVWLHVDGHRCAGVTGGGPQRAIFTKGTQNVLTCTLE
jgi:hypothetical protein